MTQIKVGKKIYDLQDVSAWDWSKNKRKFFKINSDKEIIIITELLLEYFFEYCLFPADDTKLSLKTIERKDVSIWESIAMNFLNTGKVDGKYRVTESDSDSEKEISESE